MVLKQRGTALLVFSLSAQREAGRKQIFGKGQRSRDSLLFDTLINQTETLVAQSEVDVIWMDEKKQRGHSFASRYANAFQDLFNAGYENVISIGNDCPDLTIEILQEAITSLRSQKIVAGPAADGGVYLYGLHKSLFYRDAFIKLPWQQSSLYDTICTKAQSNSITLDVLVTLVDLDTFKDVCDYAFYHGTTLLGQLLLQLIHAVKCDYNQTIQEHHLVFSPKASGLRGPPRA